MPTAINLITGETYKYKTVREHKGKSLLSAPDSYCVIDIETTGLSPEFDSIIEISALKFKDNKLVDKFSQLVKPDDFDESISEYGEYLDNFISELTGITDAMISNAKSTREILPDFLSFVGSNILIGHNVNFDINFLYDNIQYYLNEFLVNDYIDTMRLSKRLLPDLSHHRLQDLVNYFNLNYSGAHRAEKDCLLTAECYTKLINIIDVKYGNVENFIKKFKTHHTGVKATDISATSSDFDTSHPLYGKVCVFTGTLEKMVRRDAMQIVANLGGINADSVTKKTNYLILGNNDYCKSIKDGKSSKQKKAEKLKLAGQDIEIISENVFYDMIDEIC